MYDDCRCKVVVFSKLLISNCKTNEIPASEKEIAKLFSKEKEWRYEVGTYTSWFNMELSK